MSQYKITKKRLAEIIMEEYQSIQQELEEGYMDKYDREHDEYQRERKRQHDRERKAYSSYQSSGKYKPPGYGSGGIGGGSRKERFAGFNRDDELENPDKADLDDDGELSAYEKKRGKAIEKAMKKESIDAIRALIEKELQNF
tara:strand:+ start:180 stop:605 length:426 start_codon:yes stop_codon:yes gene_type:complete